MNPIFIIGTERSGTNLLRVILNSHSNIVIPHPPHIMKNFFKLEGLYRDLAKDRNFKKLINDAVCMVNLHHYPWQIRMDKEKIFRSAKERNLINVFFEIYNQYLEKSNKKRWGCKSTFMINHVALVRRYYPEAQFIYMVRDGRDVAVSAKKTIFNHYSVYYVAQLWKKEQQTGIYWLNKLSEEDILLLKYEDLLNDPQGQIRSLCSFLKEPYEAGLLNFFDTSEAKEGGRLNPAWENTSKQIIKNNYNKFRSELSGKEVELFEAIAAQELDRFSYKLTRPFFLSESARARDAGFRFYYLWEELILMLRAQIKYFFVDKNRFLRYRKFWFLKFLRIMRLVI